MMSCVNPSAKYSRPEIVALVQERESGDCRLGADLSTFGSTLGAKKNFGSMPRLVHSTPAPSRAATAEAASNRPRQPARAVANNVAAWTRMGRPRATGRGKETANPAAHRSRADQLGQRPTPWRAPRIQRRRGKPADLRVPSVAQVSGRNDRYGRFKSVAAARNRPDQARPVVSERPSQLADALHQRIVGDGQVRPDRRKELVLRSRVGRNSPQGIAGPRRALAEGQSRSRQEGDSRDRHPICNDQIAAVSPPGGECRDREWSSLCHRSETGDKLASLHGISEGHPSTTARNLALCAGVTS